ncbi:hypothetical protein Syun_013195 [Stephania yunnanensis]|uniref:BAHD acyltransferase DCR n=1 Tax=Stephania yunnanensis TaxID=152371 RepID=A0AAP0K1V4_9MAGN
MATENGKLEINGVSVGKVKVLNKATVLPSKKLGKKETFLTTFDLPYVTFYYNQKVLLYKAKAHDFKQIVEKLKDALGVVLGEFWPLAGRLGKDEEGVLRIEFSDELVDGDGGKYGVEVVEAAAVDIELAELAQNEASPLLQEVVHYTGVMNLEGLHRPLLAVQFTKVKDGIAIGCAFNHAVLDGNATWHFMSSWAEISRGAPTISVPPFHDRAKARNTRVKLDLPESTKAHEKATESQDPSDGGEPKPAPRLREKIFPFSEKAVDRIKSQVNGNVASNGGCKPFSTFQSLGVHLWRAISRARNLKAEDYTVSAVFMDCRKRVDPPMPDSYCGNLIQAIFTVTVAGMLQASGAEYGAGLLQKVIEEHDREAIEKRSLEWEAAPKLFNYKDAGINSVVIGSSPRFKIYEVDFGFGKAERVKSGSNNKFDGMIYLYQGKDEGKSIDVEVTLEAEAMENLEKDQDFLMENIN